MTKEVFLRELARGLQQLPAEEVQRQKAYYAEMLEDMMEDGIPEEDAVAKLGDVSGIVEEILQDTPLPVLVKSKIRPKKGWTVSAVVVAVLGAPLWIPLVLTAALLVFSVFLAMGAVIVAAFAMVFALAVAGLVILFRGVTLFTWGGSYVAFSLGCGLLLLGLTCLSFLGAKYAAAGLWRSGKWLFRAIKGMFIAKEGE